jgi:hypothetical protein
LTSEFTREELDEMNGGLRHSLSLCEVCGEYGGERTRRDGAIERIDCLCTGGILCRKCNEKLTPRPITNYLDRETRTFPHRPYFHPVVCKQCMKNRDNVALRPLNNPSASAEPTTPIQPPVSDEVVSHDPLAQHESLVVNGLETTKIRQRTWLPISILLGLLVASLLTIGKLSNSVSSQRSVISARSASEAALAHEREEIFRHKVECQRFEKQVEDEAAANSPGIVIVDSVFYSSKLNSCLVAKHLIGYPRYAGVRDSEDIEIDDLLGGKQIAYEHLDHAQDAVTISAKIDKMVSELK